MSASQRRKGAVGEREWCAQLIRAGFAGAKRDIDQSRDGGGDVREWPFLYEVKRHARFSTYEHFEQARVSASRAALLPAVALRGDGKDWLVVLSGDDFLSMLKAAQLFNWPPKPAGGKT